jgi:formiminotetrahydrofolate cyclodeaminase
MLINLPVTEFLRETMSDAPAPGGGSVSALAGSLAAALAVMVANLTTGGDGNEGLVLRRIRGKGGELLAALQKQVDEDTAAFNAVMSAFKLPKTTAEEKAARSGAIQDAMRSAASLPMTVAESCLEAMGLAHDALRYGNPNAASDAAVAGRMAYAGMWGAVYNVRINIASVKDMGFKAAMQKRVSAVIDQGERLLAELAALADLKISP